jgi:hypothetical protein
MKLIVKNTLRPFRLNNQELIELTHEKSVLDYTIKDNNLICNILGKSDCLEINNSIDKDFSPEKITSTDGNEANRSSNRTINPSFKIQ